jgi:hypothetical protein
MCLNQIHVREPLGEDAHAFKEEGKKLCKSLTAVKSAASGSQEDGRDEKMNTRKEQRRHLTHVML